jgi:uncharacterized membrane protein
MHDSWPHTLNIAIHVLCGTGALILGTIQLLSSKGGDRHRRLGRLFVRTGWGVVATAAIGLGLFRFGAFLAILTLLAGYWLHSGARALRLRDGGPASHDAIAAISALGAVAVFVYFLPHIRSPWVPAITYSTLATLALLGTYDLSRFLFPKRWFESLWLYEHVVKMTGAHGAMAAAFAGTVLAFLQPVSQIAPSVIWSGLQIGFVIQLAQRRRRGERQRDQDQMIGTAEGGSIVRWVGESGRPKSTS